MDSYTEFITYSDTINDIQSDSTKQLALANHYISTSTLLFDSNSEIANYISKLESNNQQLQKIYPKLLSLGVSAFNNINNSVNNLNSRLDEIQEDNNSNFEITNQIITQLQETIKELTLLNSKQSTEINRLRKAVLPPVVSNDHKSNAKFIIDNCKNQAGKSIKGASITIDNVASILAFNERLEEYKSSSEEEEKPKPTKTVKKTKK